MIFKIFYFFFLFKNKVNTTMDSSFSFYLRYFTDISNIGRSKMILSTNYRTGGISEKYRKKLPEINQQ